MNKILLITSSLILFSSFVYGETIDISCQQINNTQESSGVTSVKNIKIITKSNTSGNVFINDHNQTYSSNELSSSVKGLRVNNSNIDFEIVWNQPPMKMGDKELPGGTSTSHYTLSRTSGKMSEFGYYTGFFESLVGKKEDRKDYVCEPRKSNKF